MREEATDVEPGPARSACEDLSEEDLALIHALQLYPRATWTELATALEAPAPSLARRWQRLRAEGYAWVTSYPVVPANGIHVALAEVDCAPGRIDEVAGVLQEQPTVLGIDQAAHGRDLIVSLGGRSFEELSTLLLDGLARTPGVTSVRTHLMGDLHLDQDQWRLDALDGHQIARLRALRPASPSPAIGSIDVFGSTYGPIVTALGADGRASAAEIASRLDRPASTVRRQLTALLRSGLLNFRCEVAQILTRWPICVAWWIRLPTSQIDTAVQRIRHDPRMRYCASLTGPANLLTVAWTSTVSEIVSMQSQLEREIPDGQILDTTVILRTRKQMGWLLHPDGRCIGRAIPVVRDVTEP